MAGEYTQSVDCSLASPIITLSQLQYIKLFDDRDECFSVPATQQTAESAEGETLVLAVCLLLVMLQ